MRQVTQTEFYDTIGPQDAVLSVEGNFPYTTLFKLRNSHKLLGKAVDDYTNGKKNEYPIVTKYYLSE